MRQSGRVVGHVEFRTGDGPKLPIPHGWIDVELSQAEATVSWADGQTHGTATLPLNEFNRYVSEGAIRLHT